PGAPRASPAPRRPRPTTLSAVRASFISLTKVSKSASSSSVPSRSMRLKMRTARATDSACSASVSATGPAVAAAARPLTTGAAPSRLPLVIDISVSPPRTCPERPSPAPSHDAPGREPIRLVIRHLGPVHPAAGPHRLGRVVVVELDVRGRVGARFDEAERLAVVDGRGRLLPDAGRQ